MTEHTPGPWEISEVSTNGHVYILDSRPADSDDPDSSGAIIAELWMAEKAVQEADARLIASAPDLLSALEVFVGLCPMCYNGQECLDDNCHMARAAIAKAKGTNQ